MPEITAPNAQAYGTYEQALAQMLQGGGAIAGPLNQLALNGYARQQRGNYDLALQRTQALQAEQARRELAAETQRQYISSAPGLAEAGALGFIDPGQFDIRASLPYGQANDMTVQNNRDAESLKNRASAIGTMAGDVGLLPNEAGVQQLLLEGMIEEEENQGLLPFTAPQTIIDQQTADARTTTAAASMANATRPRGNGGGSYDDYITIEEEVRIPGGGTRTIRRRVPPGASTAATGGAPSDAGSTDASARVAAILDEIRRNRQQR
jgi:hypothetical protein